MAENGRRKKPISPELLAERKEFREMVAGMVRSAREEQGWSQAELGRRVGVSRWTISQLELGNVAVGFDVAFQLFRAFFTVTELYDALDGWYRNTWEPRGRPLSP